MVKDQLKLLRMRNTFPVFAQEANITAEVRESELELTWIGKIQSARLRADFATCAFTAKVWDTEGEKFRFTQV